MKPTTAVRAIKDEPLSEPDIRAALDRLVASAQLRAAPQLMAFLRFVVERKLARDDAHIKGYTIATEALGRDGSFDPASDPIVRVEAGRLRRALERYYAEAGSGDPVHIELPRGSYVPVFRRREPDAEPPGLTLLGNRRAIGRVIGPGATAPRFAIARSPRHSSCWARASTRRSIFSCSTA